MNDRKLNIVLRNRARELGLCDEWYGEWDLNSPKEVLINKYLKGIDFCIKNDYPKIDFIKTYVPDKLLKRHGIYIDSDVVNSDSKTVVLLGKSNGVLRYDGICTVNIYLRHQSELTIEATDGAKIFVEVYNNSKLHATSNGNSKIFVYQHGGKVDSSGNVMVRDKRKASD